LDKNIFAVLKNDYLFLTKVEKRIADFILNSPDKFIKYSMPELSEECKVSQGSINNFSKKFSSGGFSDLKLIVASYLSLYSKSQYSELNAEKSVKDSMKMKIDEYTESFLNTLEINDEVTLNEAAAKIIKAKKIEIYGFYKSAIVARDICHQLIPLGIPATYISDYFMCAVSATMLDSECLVIAVSSSGRTKEVIDCIEIAKKNNVQIIGLTSNKSSPVAKLSDNVLLASSSGISVTNRPNEYRMSELLIIDALCSYIRGSLSDDSKKEEKFLEIFNSHNVDN